MYRIIPLFFAALLIAGCSQARVETPAATATLAATREDWTIRMTQSGGIMGLMRSIEINSDGSYTVTDERMDRTVTGKLSDDELAELGGMIANIEYTAPPTRGSACADCFLYDIQIRANGKETSVHLDDVTLPDSGLESLAAKLRSMMDSELR